MKVIKKVGAFFLTLCLCVSCFSLVALAADGRISFSDPSTKVGDEVEITCAVRSSGKTIGSTKVVLSYDADYLRFRSGDNASQDGNNQVVLSSSSSGTDIEFKIKFQALKEGSTKVTISSYKVSDSSGTSLSFDQGSSAVTIAEGDPSKIQDEDTQTSSGSGKTATVDVDGVSYTLTGDFPDTMIPDGYERVDINMGGEDLPMLQNPTSGATLAYLVDSSSNADFYLYDQDIDHIWPYEEISISDTTTLVILSDTSQVNLPEIYQQATMTVNGKDFPTWQDTSNDEKYYIIYGLSSNGHKGYYRYDSTEGTYQRFDVEAEEETDVPEGLLGRLQEFIQEHPLLVLAVAVAVFLILLIIMIVVAVKLHNRNAELDDLYDEFGIDEEGNEGPEGKGGPKVSDEDEFTTDLLNDDDFEMEDLSEDDFEDAESAPAPKPSQKAHRSSGRRGRSVDDDLENVPLDENVYSGYDEREELTLDDLTGEKSSRKKAKSGDDDSFQMDFIDLD